VARLRRDVSPSLAETVDVLEVETQRLEAMARAFAQFGRLPEGPRAGVDIGELVRYTARSIVPEDMPLVLTIADDLPLVHGHHDALSRALSNVMINAVDACRECAAGSVAVAVALARCDAGEMVEITVADTGCGMEPAQLARMWEPYVTHKPGGTGLGLAIARQTVLAHEGRVEAESRPGAGTRIRLVLPVHGARDDDKLMLPEQSASGGARV
jgi:signal transduction histidine kinase